VAKGLRQKAGVSTRGRDMSDYARKPFAGVRILDFPAALRAIIEEVFASGRQV
jgi:hypothetical protein